MNYTSCKEKKNKTNITVGVVCGNKNGWVCAVGCVIQFYFYLLCSTFLDPQDPQCCRKRLFTSEELKNKLTGLYAFFTEKKNYLILLGSTSWRLLPSTMFIDFYLFIYLIIQTRSCEIAVQDLTKDNAMLVKFLDMVFFLIWEGKACITTIVYFPKLYS